MGPHQLGARDRCRAFRLTGPAIEAGTVTREEVVSKQTEIKEATKKTGLELQKELVKALGL